MNIDDLPSGISITYIVDDMAELFYKNKESLLNVKELNGKFYAITSDSNIAYLFIENEGGRIYTIFKDEKDAPNIKYYMYNNSYE